VTSKTAYAIHRMMDRTEPTSVSKRLHRDCIVVVTTSVRGSRRSSWRPRPRELHRYGSRSVDAEDAGSTESAAEPTQSLKTPAEEARTRALRLPSGLIPSLVAIPGVVWDWIPAAARLGRWTATLWASLSGHAIGEVAV
jgi:hypothetical protein